MTRLISIVGMLFALSGNVWAATTVTVAGVSGPDAKVGREGAWRAAKEGATIGEKEFLAIPAGATVRVTLPDGKVASFDGKIVVPGRRLVADKTSASNVAWLARAIQNASDAVGGVAAGQDAPGAAKPENVGSRPEQNVAKTPEGGGSRAGGSSMGMTNEESDSLSRQPEADGAKGEKKHDKAKATEPTKTTVASRTSKATSGPVVAAAPPPETSNPATPPQAERTRDVGSTVAKDEAVAGDSKEVAMAVDSSRAKLADEPAPPATARTESLRSGLAAESEGNFETAKSALTKAAAKGAKSEGDVRATRAEAYVALGRVHLQLGNPKAAALNFDQAIRLDTVNGNTGPHAARAHYLLGMAALERGDVKEARRKFGLLSGYPALDAAAKKALSEPRH